MKAANRGFLSRDALAIEVTNSYSAADASYQVRPRVIDAASIQFSMSCHLPDLVWWIERCKQRGRF
jgi:hypothetical protein